MKKLITILFLIFSQICYSQQIINTCEDNVTITYITQGLPNSTFSWTVEGGSLISANNAYITVLWPDTTGTYTVSVVETTEFGCVGDTQKITVIVKGCSFFYFPNSFTPNQDGKNEIFNIEGYNLNLEDYTLMVFDRWGEQIFESEDVDKGWDGKKGNVYCKQDVYVYKCSFTKDGKFYEKIGHVNLIK